MRTRSLLLVVLFVAVLGGCDWLQLGFDATHAGFNPSEPALDGNAVTHLSLAWQRNLLLSPVVAGGRLFATASGTPSYDLLSVNPATGAVQWHVSTNSGVATGPVIADSTVYILAFTFSPLASSLKAYDAATGAFRWAAPSTGHAECKLADVNHPPTVANGLVIFTSLTDVASPDSALCAFDASTGAFKWSVTVPGSTSAGAPAIAQRRVYFASSDFAAGNVLTVRALDATDGAVVWTKTISNHFLQGTVIVVGGRVLVPAGDLLTFDATNGAPGWTSTAIEVSATADTVITVGDGSIRALRLDSGVERWSVIGPVGTTYSKPAIANGIVYLGSTQQTESRGHCCSHIELRALSVGGLIVSLEPGNNQLPPSAIAANGVVYVDNRGGVSAYRP